MNKNFKILIISIVCFTLVGCSKTKTYTCIKEETINFGKSKEEITTTWIDDKFNSYKLENIIEYNNKEDMNELKESFDYMKEDYKKHGLEYEQKINDNKLTIIIKGNAKDIKASAINNNTSEYVNTSQTYEEYINQYKNTNYICEEK